MVFKPDNFTESAQEALANSQELVRRYRHAQWDVEPVLMALLEQEAGVPVQILQELGVDVGIVKDRLAEILGEPTAGTTGEVNRVALPGGYRITWTGMRVLKPDGSRFHGVGIQATVPVSRTIRGIAEGRDELLERAIEVVSR